MPVHEIGVRADAVPKDCLIILHAHDFFVIGRFVFQPQYSSPRFRCQYLSDSLRHPLEKTVITGTTQYMNHVNLPLVTLPVEVISVPLDTVLVGIQ